ncbi:MAG: hypothetical protein IID58_12535 [Proteobacteria bacterium]|nr:hypothetical protein [Pseudomonadota bacterium]
MSRGFPSLPNIEFLIDGNGDITIGTVGPIACAATAVDEAQNLAMLVRRDGETFEQLLLRLDRAIDMAIEEEIFIDEINYGLDDRI